MKIITNILIVPLMLFGASDGYAAINILNPAGGAGPTDGLKIFTERGQFQICRNDTRQLYMGGCDNQDPDLGDMGVGLQVDDGSGGFRMLTAYDGGNIDFFNTTPAQEISNILTGTGPWTNVSAMTGTVAGKTYSYVVTTRYTSPNYYADLEIQVTVPSGVTVAPKVFIASDFELDGNDDGPGLTQVINGRRFVVQYQGSPAAPTAMGGLLEAAPESGVQTTFGSYMEGYYRCTFGNYAASEACFDGTKPAPLPPTWAIKMGPASPTNLNYPNWIDDDVEEDAGVGGSWTLPTTQGTYTIKTILWFATTFPNPPPSPSPTGGAADHHCRFFGNCRH